MRLGVQGQFATCRGTAVGRSQGRLNSRDSAKKEVRETCMYFARTSHNRNVEQDLTNATSLGILVLNRKSSCIYRGYIVVGTHLNATNKSYGPICTKR